MSNSTDTQVVLIAFKCNTDQYSPLFEVPKYIGSALYLIPGFLLHLFIMKTVLVTERRAFRDSSFFTIFVTDSVASVIILFFDIFFGRLFLYVIPLCPIVIPFFYAPSIILKIVYYVSVHGRFSKCIAQIFMVLNRMSSVMAPTEYTRIWRRITVPAVCLIIFLPLTSTWNVAISRQYAWPLYGGFIINYIKTVEWAAVSLFQSIYILTALAFTVVCSSITLYKLIFLPDRIKSAERSLCLTSIYISVTFLLVAVTQLCYAFCPACRAEPILFILQYLAFDTFTVGSSVIIVVSNTKLRESLLQTLKLPSRKEQVIRVSSYSNPSS